MRGRSIPAILGRGGDFQELGHCPLFDLGIVMAPVGVSFSLLMCYSEHILRLRVYWKLTCLTYLPSWTHLVVISLCHVLRLCHSKVVPCPLLSCFTPISQTAEPPQILKAAPKTGVAAAQSKSSPPSWQITHTKRCVCVCLWLLRQSTNLYLPSPVECAWLRDLKTDG